jgi:UDP-glucose 4-epimerase
LNKAAVLVTGGAGYIGSHTVIALCQSGFDVVIVDNFRNSKPAAVAAIEAIVGRSLPCHRLDIRDEAAMVRLFTQRPFDAVLHFAGLKAVGESVAMPVDYYDTNVHGTLSLLKAMQAAGCRRMVFSSSCTVYGEPQRVPIDESHSIGPTNPYGHSKAMAEQILRDLAMTDSGWKMALLRYFNPVGAHESGTIGEDPNGIPNNLLPFISQVAVGRLQRLKVFGDDYDTVDGTGVRDYIHVMDLAHGHVAALRHLDQIGGGSRAINLGTGRGCSVLEMVRQFEKASGREIPFEIVARRQGDVARVFADTARAQRELEWRAAYDIERMCVDAWRWQSMNPSGL